MCLGRHVAGLLALFSLLLMRTNALTIFPPSLSHAPLFLFREDRLYDVSSYVGFDKIDGTVACLGDFNNDKYTDLIVIGCNYQCVKVYIWDSNTWSFSDLRSAQVNVTSYYGAPIITDVIASDFNFDGALDIMITTKNSVAGDGKLIMTSQIYAGDLSTLSFLMQLPTDSMDQLLLLDVNGDTRVDLFGTSSVTGQRSYWTNTPSESPTGMSFIVEAQQTLNHTVPLNPLASPSSSLYADINGDCYPDLIAITCNSPQQNLTQCNNTTLEIWLNNPDSGAYGFAMDSPVFVLDPGAGRPTFADVNRDGTLDLIVPVCYPADTCSQTNQIVIYYNSQPYRANGDLCSATSYSFSNDWKTVVSLGDKKLPNFRHSVDPTIIIPNTIRVGDYNLDGYPDFLLTVVKPSPTTAGVNIVDIELWENKICSDDMSDQDKQTYCPGSAISQGLPYFKQRTDGVSALDNNAITLEPSQYDGRTLTFSYQAYFYDIDEKGDLDIMTFLDMNDAVNSTRQLKAYYNNFFDDAYFLKTLGLSAATNSFDSSTRPYGVNMPGITVKFLITDMNGYYHSRVATQLMQSTYMALQTPYHMFGLGRTNGYVEEFYMGKGKIAGLIMWKMWSALMPNSQLVAIPSPADNIDGWTVELFIDPGSSSLWVAVAIVGTLILLGIPILILYRYEAIQDQREKQDKAHLISNVFIG
jgi:integrin alpha FG-GAP repeat containing protein 1